MANTVKSFRLYLREQPTTAAQVANLSDSEIVALAYKIGFDFTLEQWLANKDEPIGDDETYEPPNSCGCGW